MGLQLASSPRANTLHQEFRPHIKECIGQVTGGLLAGHGVLPLGYYRPRVHTFVQQHQGNTGGFIPFQYRSCHWRGAAVPRQQRGVKVEAAVRREFQNLRGKQLAIGCYDDYVGI